MADHAHGPQGIRKAAVLLLTLPEELASGLLARLDLGQIEAVASEIARVGHIEQAKQEEVATEFARTESSFADAVRGGLGPASAILQRIPGGTGRDVLAELRREFDDRPFAYLHHMDPRRHR